MWHYLLTKFEVMEAALKNMVWKNLVVAVRASFQTPILIFFGVLVSAAVRGQLSPLYFRVGLVVSLGVWMVTLIVLTAIMSLSSYYKMNQK